MERVFGETNQKVKPLVYTGGATDTAEVEVLGNQIFVNAHLPESSIAAQVEGYARDSLNYTDSAKAGQYVTEVSEAGGVISVKRQAISADDLPALEKTKILGLNASLEELSAAIGTKQDSLTFEGDYAKNNPVATKEYVDTKVASIGSFLGISLVDPLDTTRADYPDITTDAGKVSPDINDFCNYNKGALYGFDGTNWYLIADAIVHTEGGDISNTDIISNANIDQYKIKGLRASDKTGYLDQIDLLVSDAATAGSVANQISKAIDELNHTDSVETGKFVTSISEKNGILSITKQALTASDMPNVAKSQVVGLTEDLQELRVDISTTAQSLDDKISKEATARASAISALNLAEIEFKVGGGRTSEDTAPGEVIWKISQVDGKVYVSKTTLTEADIPDISYKKLYDRASLIADWNETDSTAMDYIKNKPIALSSFNNDMGYTTNLVSNLVNYYKKSEVYTQEEVNNLVSSIPKFDIQVVDELPGINSAKLSTIYLLRNSVVSSLNIYTEYICIMANNIKRWEILGSQEIDLSGYLKKIDIADWAKSPVKPTYKASEVHALPDTTFIPAALSDLTDDSLHRVVTDDQIATWDAKQAAISDLSTIREKATSAVQPEQLPTLTAETTEKGVVYKETDPTVPTWAKEETPNFSAVTLTDIDKLSVAQAELANTVSDTFFDSTHRVVTDDQIATWDAKSDFSGSYSEITDLPKINNVEVSGEKSLTDYGIVNNIQADWDAPEGSASAILNKPDSLGAVDDVLVNGASVVEDKIAAIAVPTSLAEFEGDPEHRLVSDADVAKWDAKFTIPSGGTSGQVLAADGEGGVKWDTVSQDAPVQDVHVNGKSVLANGVADIIFDTELSSTSDNALTNSAIYNSLIEQNDVKATESVGGISKGESIQGLKPLEILEKIITPYAAPSIKTRVLLEYGSAQTIDNLILDYTEGSRPITKISIGSTEGGAEYYETEAPVVGESISLLEPIVLDGVTEQTIYYTFVDTSDTTTIPVIFGYSIPDYYFAGSQVSLSRADMESFTATQGGTVSYMPNDYVFFFTQTDGCKIQQAFTANSDCWFDVDTTELGLQTVTLLNDETAVFYCYRTEQMIQEGSCTYRLYTAS